MRSIGLVLGGGGARGLAHIGVLKVIEREKIPISCIAGTSMGAIIGARYAVYPDIASLENTIKEALSSSLFSRMKFSLFKDEHEKAKKTFFKRAQGFLKNGYLHLVEETRPSLLEIDALKEIITVLLPDIDIRQTKIPFACVATDLTHGREKIFTRGPLRQCVLASASIPGIFPPVEIDGILYTDGGGVSVCPVDAAKIMGAEIIVASDVKSRIMKCERQEKAKDILSRYNYITGVLLNDLQLREADVVISPSVKHMHWSEFGKVDYMAHAGEKAAASKTWEIKARICRRGIHEWWDRFTGVSRAGRWFNANVSVPLARFWDDLGIG